MKVELLEEEEVWKDIPGYEGLYQASNLGKVKSLPRSIFNGKGYYISKEKLLNLYLVEGYYRSYLTRELKAKSFSVHQLVAMAFLGHTPCGYQLVVDHINDNMLDNRVENLQIVSHRFNTYKTQGKYTSEYKGVNWDKQSKKWRAKIQINGKSEHLGVFDCEFSAHLAYQNKLKELI